MPVKVEFEGMDAIVRQMRALGPDAQKARKAALMAGSKVLAEEVRIKAPRSATPRKPTAKNSWRTGKHMADVVRAEYIPRTKTGFGGVGTPGGVARGPYFYIRFLEYGTERIKPRRFVQKAAEARGAAIASAVGSELKNQLGL